MTAMFHRRLGNALIVLGLGLIAGFLVDRLIRLDRAGSAAAQFEVAAQQGESVRTNADSRATESGPGREPPPIGVLRIPDLGIVAPVYGSAGARELALGVGLITGTAGLNEIGNTGLAAHRDSFFRALKDVRVGQLIEVSTDSQTRRFRVTGHEIVLPSAVGVLAPASTSKLTLVTCYPFYFVGKAPKRFIVFAEAV